ncbi:MAG: sulfite exporter TauE/SafE family protein [Hyphomicrobiaceae bacterium]
MSVYLPIAELAIDLRVLITLGLVVGFLSGMFGIGGGFITTPFLIFLGVPPAIAVGTGASQVVASSVSGAIAHWQRGNVDLRMGLLLIGGGMVGATTGIIIQRLLKAAGQLDFFIAMSYVILLGTVGGLMLVESVRAMRPASGLVKTTSRRGGQHIWVQRLPIKMRFRTAKLYISAIPPVLIGAAVGWLTAIMGVGGGFLLVPALIYLLRVPTRVVIGTSQFQVVFTTAFATLLQATQNFSVDLLLAAPLMIAGVFGAQYGVRAGQRLKAEQLRALLAILVLLVAIRLAFGLVIVPEELFELDDRP